MLFAYTWKGRYDQPGTTLCADFAKISLAFWPPKYGNAVSRNACEVRSAVVDGNAPPLIRVSLPSSTAAYLTNAYASALFADLSGTASELPPFSALALAPASHCGMGATRHLPDAAAAPETRLPGIQAPVGRLAMVPLPRALNHSSLHGGIDATSFSVIIGCQVVAYFWAPGSAKLIVTLVPSTVYGLPPACQIMLVVKPASPVSPVIQTFGLALCSLRAAVT